MRFHPLILILILASGLPASHAADLPANALTSAPAQNRCFELVQARDPDTESACSDAIAYLSLATTLTMAEQIALASAYNNRAIARTRERNLEGADADIYNALTLAPDSSSLYLNRGNLRLSQGRFQDALADYARVLEMAQVPWATVHRNSALAFRALGDITNAEIAMAMADAPATRHDAMQMGDPMGGPSEDRPAPPGIPPP